MAYPQPPPGLYSSPDEIPEYDELPSPEAWVNEFQPVGKDFPEDGNWDNVNFPLHHEGYRIYRDGAFELKLSFKPWNSQMAADSIQHRANQELIVFKYWRKYSEFGPKGQQQFATCSLVT